MQTDQLALVVSIASAAIACLALGWNIYRDVLLKAKVVTSFSIVFILHDSLPDRPQYLNITATNFGPGVTTLSSIVARNAPLWRRLLRKVQYAIITPDYGNAMSGRLPKKLETGDKIELLLPYDAKCLLGHEFTHVGVTDFFGRTHWAPKKQMKKARTTWRKDHNSHPTVELGRSATSASR
ncbi:hypothetical protein ACVNIS_06465 [Sphaerotilaceae bacterium SBD11-9]